MQFSTLLIATLAAFATATPAKRGTLCSSAIDDATCCETSVDGIAELTCESPTKTPWNVADFKKICAAEGLTAQCCTAVTDETGLVCSDP